MRKELTILYFVAAAVFLGLSTMGGWWWLFLYPSHSFFFAGLAYKFNHPAIISWKNPETGELPLLCILLFLPFYVSVWIFWFFKSRLSGEPPYNEIAPGLYLGRYPLFPSEFPPGVQVVVDLCAEFPRQIFLTRNLTYYCLPTLDTSTPERLPFHQLITKLSPLTQPTYIHCANGHGRSALVMLALIFHRQSVQTIDQGYFHLKERRPKVHIHFNQLEFIKNLHDNNSNNANE